MSESSDARAAPVPGDGIPVWRARRSSSRTSSWRRGFIGLFGFVIGPMIASLGLSLTTYNIVKPPTFIGVDNYVRAFTKDPLFWSSLVRTFTYAIIIVPLGVGGSLLVAVLLNQGLRMTSSTARSSSYRT